MQQRNDAPETIDAVALKQVVGGAGWGDAVDGALGAGLGFGGKRVYDWLRGSGNQPTPGGNQSTSE